MTWWLWAALGLVLCAIELATPGGFFVIFFGIAAMAVGLLQLAGVELPAWAQWLAFPILAIVALRLFRRPLLDRLQPAVPGDIDSLVGEVARPVAAIGPGQFGRVEARGTMWAARNVGTTAVSPGERGRVVAVNGLQLDIRPE
jgi:membrane protein implicated in regulation of membrane protease activity